jgi:hypothetical protein
MAMQWFDESGEASYSGYRFVVCDSVALPSIVVLESAGC